MDRASGQCCRPDLAQRNHFKEGEYELTAVIRDGSATLNSSHDAILISRQAESQHISHVANLKHVHIAVETIRYY